MPTRDRLHRPKLTTATIDLGDGDSLNVVFDRDRITLGWIRAAQEGDVLRVGVLVAEITESWDLFEADGVTPVPLTADELATLSMDVLNEIVEAIGEAAAPSRAEGNDSSEPSNTPLSGFTEPNGTHPSGEGVSPSPTPSASPSLT